MKNIDGQKVFDFLAISLCLWLVKSNFHKMFQGDIEGDTSLQYDKLIAFCIFSFILLRIVYKYFKIDDE